MFRLSIKSDFSSAHNLRGYKGKCEALHGHNWEVEVNVSAEKLDKIGLAADFHLLKEKLKEVIDSLDHKYLNEMEYFAGEGGVNPSSENIAKFIYDKLKDKLLKTNTVLESVTVWESKNCCATYSE